jgi:hypothetical protein
MGVQFVAVQELDRWRVVGHHTTLDNAIFGSRGALDLLRNQGAQKEKVRRYGPAQVVFIWEAEDTHARTRASAEGRDRYRAGPRQGPASGSVRIQAQRRSVDYSD